MSCVGDVRGVRYCALTPGMRVRGSRRMHNLTTIQSHYFDERDISIGEDEIVVVSCMRNEAARLPFFLDYYRRLGVSRFLLIDNHSTDGTEELLRGQDDVEYFRTSASYRGSSAGRLWMQELADTYAIDRWVLTVDVDELLVFPGIEKIGLASLCAYMDSRRQRGLFTVMLDMYSAKPLAETTYTPGTDFLETCPYFETDTYCLAPNDLPPFLGIYGGPRGRLFGSQDPADFGPMMKKIPLIRWRRGFSYIYSTHSHRFVPLSDVTGTLLHFKFFASFETVAARDAERGDRRQLTHYSAYQSRVGPDLCFHGSHSRRYRSASDLVRLGIMCSSNAYAEFLESLMSTGSDPGEDDAESDISSLLPEAEPSSGMTIRALHDVWPLISNPQIAAYFGKEEREPRDPRVGFIRSMRRRIRVLDVGPDHLLVYLHEVALHRWERSNLGLAVFVDDQHVCNILADGADSALRIDETALEPRVYRLPVDISGAVRRLGSPPSVTVTVYLFDAADGGRLRAPIGSPEAGPQIEDLVIHSNEWFPEGIDTSASRRYRGVVDRLVDGKLRGWAYDAIDDRFDVGVCIYVNGRFVRHLTPTRWRRDLGKFRTGSSSRGGRGFLEALPLGYFADNGASSLRIEAKVAGTNVALRRSPLTLPIGEHNLVWDSDTLAWVRPVDSRPGDVPMAREPGATARPGARPRRRSGRAGLRGLFSGHD